VILGGDMNVSEIGGSVSLGEHTTQRCLRGWEIYCDAGPCPVIVTGGPPGSHPTAPSVASLMAEFLHRLGVEESDLVVEERARNTLENSERVASILNDRSLGTPLLVTDALHMPRAVACFERQGTKVVPAACEQEATDFVPDLLSLFPSANAAGKINAAAYEWLGLLSYKLRGHI
jgi:uncharacterized SAM-binding protein YcdF (DUF218 family)